MRVRAGQLHARSASADANTRAASQQHAQWDPKDGELCLGRAKPGETLVEARRRSDVQIDVRTRAWGRKTNRTVW